MSKPLGLAVPNYSLLKIPSPYFGDLVWSHLQELDKAGEFEYIPIEVIPFSDGSEKNIIKENCRDKVVYVMHTLYVQPARHVMLAAQIFDNLRRSDATEGGIHCIELYNPYFSQDSRADREPITAKIVADLYKDSGLNCLFVADPHFKQLSALFKKLEALPMSATLARHIKDNYDISNAVVSPADDGAYGRASRFATILGIQLVPIHKERIDEETVVIRDILGDVKGKDVFLRDDVIRKGTSLKEAEEALRQRGARKIYAVETHLGLYEDAIEMLRDHDIHVIGTNSIPHDFTEEERKFIDVVDISHDIADVIYTKSQKGSLRTFFKNKIDDVKRYHS
jgi:ribose-phosphate pyrophosphokinase